MSASMAGAMRTVCRRYLGNIPHRHISRRHESKLATVEKDEEDVIYPPVKPEFPPGAWPAALIPSFCWRFYEEGQDLLKVTDVRERLEWFAGKDPIWLTLSEPFDLQPNTRDYCQHITKTHIAHGVPDLYEAVNVEKKASALSEVLTQVALQENDYHQKVKKSPTFSVIEEETLYNRTHSLLGQILRCITSREALNHPHILRSQIDEDVRVESFWKCGGFSHKGYKAEGIRQGILGFQYRGKSNYQIRTEEPLPEFVPLDHELSIDSKVPEIDYQPNGAGQKLLFSRRVSVSGHWIGDPCEFTTTSLHVMPSGFSQFEKMFAENADVVEQKILTYGLMSAFSSCLAQAYNQGFSYYHELTYPITTQSLVTVDGESLRFFSYQLNTMQMWKDSESNPRRNILWVSDKMPMFERDSDGRIEGINMSTLQHLLKCVLIHPSDRGIDLRPYLQQEDAPVHKKCYINDRGQEPLPYKKIERWQYPRNSVYF